MTYTPHEPLDLSPLPARQAAGLASGMKRVAGPSIPRRAAGIGAIGMLIALVAATGMATPVVAQIVTAA